MTTKKSCSPRAWRMNDLAMGNWRERARRDQADARARGGDRRGARASNVSRSRRRRASAAPRSASRISTATRSRPSTTPRSTRCATATRAPSATIWRASSTRRWASPAWPPPVTGRRSSCSRICRCSRRRWQDWTSASAHRDDGLTDVLFEIETGLAPARVSKQFPLPIPINGTLILIPISFPVMRSRGRQASSPPSCAWTAARRWYRCRSPAWIRWRAGR